MATILPLEIETEILLLLPAKSLQRLSSVCKLWHSLITSSSFISSYNDYSSSNSKFLLLKHPHPVPLLPSYLTSIHFSLFDDSLTELSTIKVPQELPTDQECDTIRPTRVELITSTSINGVLCILVHMGLFSGINVDCDLFLWNPSTSEKVKIPSSEFTGLFSGSPMLKFYCGFGFGCENYKVVRVVYMNDAHYTVEIYSLRENSWKCLGKDFCSGILSNTLWAHSTCTFVNGVGYWGCHRNGSKDKFFVLEFDFEKECFKGMEVPVECVNGGEMRYQSLWVYHGLLAISVLRFGEFDSGITRHYIWAMKVDMDSGTYQWNKLFNIDIEGGPRRPMVTLKNGELLLLGEVDGEHTLYDPKSEEIKRIDIFDVEAVVPYVESLVSLSQLMPK